MFDGLCVLCSVACVSVCGVFVSLCVCVHVCCCAGVCLSVCLLVSLFVCCVLLRWLRVYVFVCLCA